jgi:hypothetical protein
MRAHLERARPPHGRAVRHAAARSEERRGKGLGLAEVRHGVNRGGAAALADPVGPRARKGEPLVRAQRQQRAARRRAALGEGARRQAPGARRSGPKHSAGTGAVVKVARAQTPGKHRMALRPLGPAHPPTCCACSADSPQPRQRLSTKPR